MILICMYFSSGKICDPNEHSFILKALKKLIFSLPVHVHLVFLYLCVYLSLLKRCLHSSASLVYRKCNKKTVAEGVASLMSLLFPINWRSGVRVVTMIVFVNQMLLMRAGDVERNPGPGKRDICISYNTSSSDMAPAISQIGGVYSLAPSSSW